MRNMRLRRLIAMIMTVITVGAQSPLTAMAGELTDDLAVTETVTDGEETSEVTDEAQNETAEVTENTEVSSNEADVVTPEDTTQEENVSEGFALSAADYAAKQAIIDHNALEDFASLTEGVDYVSNEVILKADSEEYAKAVAEAYGATLKSYSYGVAVLDLADSQLSIGQAYAMGADVNIALPVVEPNYIVTFDDPEISEAEIEAKKNSNILESKKTQWDDFGLYDPLLDPADPNFQWWHQYIDSYGAWGVFSSYYKPYIGSDIKVGVIDSGVTASHEELRGHTEARDIGLGTVDENGHGTHVAGLIGASIANSYGGSGIAPGVQIYGYRASNAAGKFEAADTVRAINKAVEDGVNIINMSLGGPTYGSAEDQALQAAYAAGITVVAAAGNQGKNGYSYPAAYEHVISVGASDESGYKTNFSNYGSWVDVMAPGANMRSSYPGGGNDTYCTMQGTSQACPVVAGACALYMSACGKVSPDDMEAILKRSTTKCNTSDACATGIINIAKMFDGDTTAPQIDMLGEDGTTSVCTAASGSYETCSATVKGDQYIKFTGKGFNGDEDGNKNTTYYITVDGSNPDPHNAYYYTDYYSYSTNYKTYRVGTGNSARTKAGYLLRIFNHNKPANGTFTVKAVAVTGRGVISGVTSMQITVDPELYYYVDAYGGPAGNTFAQGTSMQLYSTTYVSSTWAYESTNSGVDQGVKWSIESNSGCSGTSISETGLVTIGAGDSGSFTVKCQSTAYPEASDTLTFSVAKRAPVASVVVLEETLTQLNDEIVIREWGEVQPEIKLKMKLTDGTEITSDLPYVSWSSSDSWVAEGRRKSDGVSGNRINVVYPKSKGKCTLTGTVQDGSNTQFTVNVKVKALIYAFDMYGQSEIAQGKSAKYKAVPLSHTQYRFLHNYTKYDKKLYKKYGVSDKKYTWSIKNYTGTADTEISGVSVKKGKVKVASSVAAGTTFSVAVTADEGTTEKAMNFIPVMVTGSSGGLIVTTDATDPAYDVKVNKKGSVTSVQLFIRNVSTSPVDESYIDLKVVASNGARVYWKRNNYNTSASSSELDTLRVSSNGYKAQTTYSFETHDGTKKKAKVKVSVIVPVASMQITANGLETYANEAIGADMLIAESGITTSYMSSGCSTKLAVAFGDEYGPATKKKVTWEGKAGYMNESGFFTEDTSLSNMFSLKNGTLKFSNAFTTDFTMNRGVLVTATATDGSGLKAQKFVVACKKTTFLKFDHYAEGIIYLESDGTAGASGAFQISTTSAAIACPELCYVGKNEKGNVVYGFAIYKPKKESGGPVTFTITIKDGSNKKISIPVNMSSSS